jgi:hypothetical protein
MIYFKIDCFLHQTSFLFNLIHIYFCLYIVHNTKRTKRSYFKGEEEEDDII